MPQCCFAVKLQKYRVDKKLQLTLHRHEDE